MNITYDILKREYIDQLVELERQCFALPWSRGMFLHEIDNPNAIYIVAFDGDVVAGYIGCWQIIFEGHITNVCVSPAYRRRGLGSDMLCRMMHTLRCDECTEVTLEVRRSNAGAIALYEKHGFVEVGVRRGYYEDNGEDALIMTAPL